MATYTTGPRTWSGSRDKNGHRTYKITFRVLSDTGDDGPARVLLTDGVPQPGDMWEFFDDLDPWAWCRPDAAVTPVVTDGQKTHSWDVEYTFSSEPLAFCQDRLVEDPLSEPNKMSGSFRTVTEEATKDRFQRPITNSAHEPLRGPQVEFDRGFVTVKVEQNVRNLDMDILQVMIQTVNSDHLWGFPPRCVKLSRITWECLYTSHCEAYVKRTLEFDADPRTWDRDIMDEGTSVLRGKWSADGHEWIVATINGQPADPLSPKHFMQYKDALGEPKHVILNGAGIPADSILATTDRYLSIQDFNDGHALSESSWWMPLASTDAPAAWDITRFYPAGSVVTLPPSSNYWVSVVDIFPGDAIPTANSNWVQIPNFINSGVYNEATEYDAGEYVSGSTATTVGYRHVSVYEESDFLTLGIPAELGCQFNFPGAG